MFSLRNPSSIFGSSEGFNGSAATFITDKVLCWSGLKMQTSSGASGAVSVPVLTKLDSTPSTRAQQPAGTSVTSTRYLAW